MLRVFTRLQAAVVVARHGSIRFAAPANMYASGMFPPPTNSSACSQRVKQESISRSPARVCTAARPMTCEAQLWACSLGARPFSAAQAYAQPGPARASTLQCSLGASVLGDPAAVLRSRGGVRSTILPSKNFSSRCDPDDHTLCIMFAAVSWNHVCCRELETCDSGSPSAMMHAISVCSGRRNFATYASAGGAKRISQNEFTEKAWQSIIAAPDIAQNASQQIVDTEHLFKALLEQPNGLARRILSKAGSNPTQLLEKTDQYIRRQPRVTGDSSQVLNAFLTHTTCLFSCGETCIPGLW